MCLSATVRGRGLVRLQLGGFYLGAFNQWRGEINWLIDWNIVADAKETLNERNARLLPKIKESTIWVGLWGNYYYLRMWQKADFPSNAEALIKYLHREEIFMSYDGFAIHNNYMRDQQADLVYNYSRNWQKVSVFIPAFPGVSFALLSCTGTSQIGWGLSFRRFDF